MQLVYSSNNLHVPKNQALGTTAFYSPFQAAYKNEEYFLQIRRLQDNDTSKDSMMTLTRKAPLEKHGSYRGRPEGERLLGNA